MLEIIKAALWGADSLEVGEEDYKEMQLHAISSLAGPVLSKLKMTS